jgi:hypothetical protein
MGLWKEHFHWSVLLGWDVLAWILPFLLCIAGLFLMFDQYWSANVCFILTGGFVFAKIVDVGSLSTDSILLRTLFTFVLSGIIGVAVVESVRGVNRWAYSKKRGREQAEISRTPVAPISNTPAGSAAPSPRTTLPSISRTIRFSTVVPINDASKNVPIPMNTNNEDPKADFYQDLLGLAARSDQPPPGIVYKERKLETPGDKFIFVSRLVQYEVLHSLRILQGGRSGTRWIAGKGVTPIDVMPIPAPDATPYATATLINSLGDNEFLKDSDRMFWNARPFELPRGTIISLSEKPPSDGPLECSVRFERPHYYRIEFVVSPGPAIQGQPPAGFQSPTQTVSSYPVTVTMSYTIHRHHDSFNADAYSQWADALFLGLRNAMAP